MLPYILAAVGGYLIGDSLNLKQYAKGGKISKTKKEAENTRGDDIEILNGYFQQYRSGNMTGKKDEGYVTISDEDDLTRYITDKLGNVVKKITLIEKGKNYPYNRSNPYFEDIYNVELISGKKIQIIRSYGRPNWSGNVSWIEEIKAKQI